jgi:NADH dehydrogenase FAD-containing subunit
MREPFEIPYGLAVWCTGIKLNPLCEKIIDAMPAGAQANRRSLVTVGRCRLTAPKPMLKAPTVTALEA